jgi:hypothetical protein
VALLGEAGEGSNRYSDRVNVEPSGRVVRRCRFAIIIKKGGCRQSEQRERHAYVPPIVASSRPSIQMPGLARKNAASASTRVMR